MANIAILAGLLVSSASAFAVSEAECPSFDYSSHFGPIRQQGSRGLCWAFTTVGLYEEALCLTDHRYCGVEISALDAARFNPRIGTSDEAGNGFTALTSILKFGACRESHAPYKKGIITPVCKENRLKLRYPGELEPYPFEKESADEKVRVVAEALREGKSLGATLVVSKLPANIVYKFLARGMRHELIINGMRWNKDRPGKEFCEIQLRNSEGEKSWLNGWHSADKILPAVDGVWWLRN